LLRTRTSKEGMHRYDTCALWSHFLTTNDVWRQSAKPISPGEDTALHSYYDRS
jgi:hypothetical protein